MKASTLNRRSFLAATGAGAFTFSLPHWLQSPAVQAYNGHPALKTPHLDDMAASGLRFDRFYAAAPVCSPTRASVLTGRHPNRMGCFQWGGTLRPQEVTIAEALRATGYVTGHFGKWHVGSVLEGSPVNPGACGFDEWLSAPNFYDCNPILSREGRAVQLEGESSEVTAEAAIEFIRKHANGLKPFFAVVWFGSPHNPHEASAEDRERYSNAPEELRDFYGEITGLDRAVGQLRNALRELEVSENTLFWYCSDNGGLPKLGATGGRGNKGDLYEGGLRVPAIMEWPARITQPYATREACVTSDIYPTLIEITGAKVERQPPLDGISLMPIIRRMERVWLRTIGFWNYPVKGSPVKGADWMRELFEAQEAGLHHAPAERLHLNAGEIRELLPAGTRQGHAAWMVGTWKLHRIEDADGMVTRELYALHHDPMEENNLIADEPGIAQDLCRRLESWQASVVRSHNGEDYGNWASSPLPR
jgi:hypothetical protein